MLHTLGPVVIVLAILLVGFMVALPILHYGYIRSQRRLMLALSNAMHQQANERVSGHFKAVDAADYPPGITNERVENMFYCWDLGLQKHTLCVIKEVCEDGRVVVKRKGGKK